MTFTVTRTGDAQGTQTVDYALSGIAGAAAVSDAGTASSLHAALPISKTITININDDLLDETNETVTVTLSNPTGSVVNPTIGTAAATTTMLDNHNNTTI